MRPALLLLLLGLFPACRGDQTSKPLEMEPSPDPLVDNLYISKPEPGAGGYTHLGGSAGEFAIAGRCLVLTVSGEPRTPIFRVPRERVRVARDALYVSGQRIEYSATMRLPMAGAPHAISSKKKHGCPAIAVSLPVIEP